MTKSYTVMGVLAATAFLFSPLVRAAENTYEDRVIVVIGPHHEVIMGSVEEMKEKRLAAGHFDKAQGLYGEGRYAEAAEQYEIAARHEPFSADIFNNLGAAYSSLGDRKKANRAYKKALELDPRHEAAIANFKKVSDEKK